jgi:5-methylcytosine-specific restriction protein B
MFTWVPTHKEIARQLLNYEHRQQELINILREAGESILNDLDENGQTIPLEEIDPFTFFCYIYKYGPEKTIQRLQHVSQAFGITPIPEDINGLPTANAQKVWLFPYKKERRNFEID